MAHKLKELFYEYLDNHDKLFSDMDDAIGINDNNLSRDQKYQPELYLHWSRLHAIGEAEIAKQQAHIDQVVWPAAQERAIAAIKAEDLKATSTLIESKCKIDPLYQQASALRLALQELTRYLEKMANALYMRKDMLQSIGARQRIELESMPDDIDTIKSRAKSVLARKYKNEEDE